MAWICHGYCLNEKKTKIISTSLTSEELIGFPEKLINNKSRCFQGSVPLGNGFFLKGSEVESLLNSSEKNGEVIFKYITGKELNNSPNFHPGRWVIYFRDWPLEKCKEYPDILRLVKERVKPERDKIIPKNNMAKQRKELWWKFTGPTVELYDAIKNYEKALVSAVVSKHHAFVFIPSDYIYANTLNVFGFDTYDYFSVLQSSIHMAWALFKGSKLGATPRYNVSDCFETFPFPEELNGLEAVGQEYDNHRQTIMQSNNEGLTATYNRFHEPKESSGAIQKLRHLHVEIDKTVAVAYGWEDMDLGHGFHETKHGVSFTISEETRRELLQRLLKLNHERYEEEVLQGLHDKKKQRKKSTSSRGKKKTDTTDKKQGKLF